MASVETDTSATRLSLRKRAALIAIAAVAVFVLSALWRPADDGFVLCLWRRATSVPCPSCGMTRAFCALSRGEWSVALDYNFVAPAVYGLLWVVLALASAELTLGRAFLVPAWQRSKRVLVPFYLVAMAIVWVVELFEHFSR